MATTIDWLGLDWDEGDDFISFAFGEFNSKDYGIVRTSNSDRYEEKLSLPMNDKTADVPGADGQYYFGTTYKPKVFDVSFAFEDLTKDNIRSLKQAFSGKEMRELCFAESCTYDSDNGITDARVYMAKVTSQPNIKALCFDGVDNGGNPIEVYNGEGSVQFTAYWPYAREETQTNTASTNTSGFVRITINNAGDIPTTFTISASAGATISQIDITNSDDTITLVPAEDSGVTTYNSKTGIMTNQDEDIKSYSGNGVISLPLGETTIEITGTSNKAYTITHDNWYY